MIKPSFPIINMVALIGLSDSQHQEKINTVLMIICQEDYIVAQRSDSDLGDEHRLAYDRAKPGLYIVKEKGIGLNIMINESPVLVDVKTSSEAPIVILSVIAATGTKSNE
ncbi:hypothetical protein CY34DRAFT_108176 [Suillus luteus UH-Slu-Lm8-n1]|uniref:Uncharacterized protein n=1 Tax=Suillus luteus UH-Slu-Lm8-n1 TaxID=930992 RepID=A0A0C9ZPI3_9AGAM|nr:hypothetical protein CY34DRAFT_108176 [Suillus luteus UH-Slu-Lm8-n1]